MHRIVVLHGRAVLISIRGTQRHKIEDSKVALFGFQKKLEEECCGKKGY